MGRREKSRARKVREGHEIDAWYLRVFYPHVSQIIHIFAVQREENESLYEERDCTNEMCERFGQHTMRLFGIATSHWRSVVPKKNTVKRLQTLCDANFYELRMLFVVCKWTDDLEADGHLFISYDLRAMVHRAHVGNQA